MESGQMVAFSFNAYGYAFQRGVDLLERGFKISTTALVKEYAKLRKELATYEASVSEGGERIGEWEDGHCLWERLCCTNG
jgi:hypothetical protein